MRSVSRQKVPSGKKRRPTRQAGVAPSIAIVSPGGTPAAQALPHERIRIVDLAIVLGLALFMCVYRIGDYSFGGGDQTTHSLVVQGFVKGQDLLHPMYAERPYFNKPPFKMWLAAAAVALLGESNFSYRVVDGLCGVGMALLLFTFTVRAFRSRAAGYAALFALLGSSIFFYGHGVRNAVQDSMMNLLVTAAIVAGYFTCERLANAPAGARLRGPIFRAGIGIGMLSAAAVMTKNVAGLIAFPILGLHFILSPSLRRHLRDAVFPAFVAVVIALAPFGAYMASQGRWSTAAWQMMMKHEIVKRATVGYHNRHAPFFYLEGLFSDGLTVPPALLVLSLLYALWRFGRRRERALGLVLLWCVVPVVLYSCARSKLMWYILPAVPALAVLAGLTVAALFAPAMAWWQGRTRGAGRIPARAALPLGAGVVAVLLLGLNVYAIAEKNLSPKKRVAIDLIVEELLRESSHSLPKVRLVQPLKLGRHEELYLGMLGDRPLSVVAREPRSGGSELTVVSLEKFDEIARATHFSSYVFLPPRFRRREWLALLLQHELTPEPMTPTVEELTLSQPDVPVLFGLRRPLVVGAKRLAISRGLRTGLLLEGDLARATFGTDIELFLASLHPATKGEVAVDATLNGVLLGSLEAVREGFHLRSIRVPPGVWQRGSNALVLSYRRSDGTPITADDELILYESISVRLLPGRLE